MLWSNHSSCPVDELEPEGFGPDECTVGSYATCEYGFSQLWSFAPRYWYGGILCWWYGSPLLNQVQMGFGKNGVNLVMVGVE